MDKPTIDAIAQIVIDAHCKKNWDSKQISGIRVIIEQALRCAILHQNGYTLDKIAAYVKSPKWPPSSR